jgi:hypothetical protein
MSQTADINATYWSENYRKATENSVLVAYALERYANAQNLNEQALAKRLKLDIMQLYQLGMCIKPNNKAEIIALAGGMRIDSELLDLILSQNYTISREFYVFKLENYKPIQVAGPFFAEPEANAESKRLIEETGFQHIVTGKVHENVAEPPKPTWADSPYAKYYELFNAIDNMEGIQHTHITETTLVRYYKHIYILLQEDLPKFEPDTPLPPEIIKAQKYVERGIKERWLHIDDSEEA